MEKNETGYPVTQRAVGDGSQRRSCTGELINGDRAMPDAAPHTQNATCGGGGVLDGMSLAYVYAPDQKFCMLYSAADALKHGTLFEELYKPREVYGNE